MIAPASIGPASGAPTLSSFSGSPPELVDLLLAEQASLTAVERFAERAESGAGHYRDLLPLREPGPGEQYAFEVDLDRCSGCKACVTACHNLNGLDEDETWRQVGLVHRAEGRPVQQHVTTACHHCAEPGCAQGCPVLAYEKDPVTGVVRHLDDQCFGCQYCILKCPYDVPQYSPKRGIVRKCDLCVGRLRAGEAPACAQACPTQAIRITLIDLEELRADPAAAFDIPGAPDPAWTLPTTRYLSAKGLPENLVAVDAHQIKLEHAHWPLVFMLVASQTAAGYWILWAAGALAFGPVRRPGGFPLPEIIGFSGTAFAVALSLLHLGRPWLAWKAALNWRRSWLSREVIAFSALLGAAALCAALGFLSTLPRLPATVAEIAVALAAAAALHASAMVYRDTPRRLWATRATSLRFVATAFLCGIPAYLLAGGPAPRFAVLLPALLTPLMLLKLSLESRVLRHREDEDFNPLWKAAQLLLGRLGPLWRLRLTAGILGGAILPLLLTLHALPGSPAPWIALMLIVILAGELAERAFFFVTAASPRMPGGR